MKKIFLLLFIGFLIGCSSVIASNYLEKDVYELNINDSYALLRGDLTTQSEYYQAFQMIGFVKGVVHTFISSTSTEKEYDCINKSPLVWEDIIFDKYKKSELSSSAIFADELIKEVGKCIKKK
jgi:hypothetical protein